MVARAGDDEEEEGRIRQAAAVKAEAAGVQATAAGTAAGAAAAAAG